MFLGVPEPGWGKGMLSQAHSGEKLEFEQNGREVIELLSLMSQ